MALHSFTWVVEGELAAMAAPSGDAQDWRTLRQYGVGGVVCLTEWGWDVEELRKADLRYLHLPMRDFHPPGPEQIQAFVEFCEECLAEKRAVVVHCLAGRGRTGTMAACYLVHRGWKPEEALEALRQLRPGSVETPAQEQAVHAYAARMRAGFGGVG